MKPTDRKELESPREILNSTISNKTEETFEFGFNFSRLLNAGSVVALFGDLGSGKTTMIKGIGAGLKVNEPITSPTFTIINEYSGKWPVFHFDFYRLSSYNELVDLGIKDYFYSGDGICLIEWPEMIVDILPENHYQIYLRHLFKDGFKDKREIIIYKKAELN